MSEIEKRWNKLKKASKKNRQTLEPTIRYQRQYIPVEIVPMVGQLLY